MPLPLCRACQGHTQTAVVFICYHCSCGSGSMPAGLFEDFLQQRGQASGCNLHASADPRQALSSRHLPALSSSYMLLRCRPLVIPTGCQLKQLRRSCQSLDAGCTMPPSSVGAVTCGKRHLAAVPGAALVMAAPSSPHEPKSLVPMLITATAGGCLVRVCPCIRRQTRWSA